MGRRTKKCRGPAGRPPACDPARPRSARAGFESEGRRRAVWNQAWAPGLPDMGCDLSAIAGALARVTSGRRVEDGGAFPSRGAATPNRDGLSRTAHGRYAHGAAGGEAALHAERLRCCAARPSEEGGRLMMGIKEKDERRELLDAVADAGRLAQGPASRCSSPSRTPTSWTSRRRGHTGPEVDKREMRRAHRGRRAHPGGCRTRSFMPNSQRRPSKRNAPLSAGKPSRCPPRLFDSGRRPELGRPWSA